DVIDLENLICISDSEDEVDLKPTVQHSQSSNVITIIDDDDDVFSSKSLYDSTYKNNKHIPALRTGKVSKPLRDDPGSQSDMAKSIIKETQSGVSFTSNTPKPNFEKTLNTKVPLPRKRVIDGNTVSTKEPHRPVASQSSSIHIPKKWLDPSLQEARAEQRASNALLSKAIAASQGRKLSLPRSALLKNSALAKRPSTIMKATSPLKTTSLKRPMESPERPHLIRSTSFDKPSPLVFNSTLRRSPERQMRRDSFEWPTQTELSAAMLGSPDRITREESLEPERTFQRASKRKNSDVYGSPGRGSPIQQTSMQARGIVYSSPDRETPIQRASRQTNTAICGSPERSTYLLSSPTVEYPSNLRKPKTSSSPFSKPTFQKPKVVHELYDEDGKEEDLELFVSIMSSSRRKLHPNNAPKIIKMQCPLCYIHYPKNELNEHAADCGGDPEATGNERIIRKNTIGAAVLRNEAERKRLNKGKVDNGPTNYYADPESVLALDGSGFNTEASGISWESAGQTRFG
ncbi:hypothetical protein INT47_005451, partial [Mucor saturninus]